MFAAVQGTSYRIAVDGFLAPGATSPAQGD